MLNVNFFTFNAFEENTYIISNHQKECWIVDPGMYHPEEIAQVISFIEQKQLVPKAIINTHAHIDHIFGVNALVEKYKIPFAIHKDDLPMLTRSAEMAAMFGFDLKPIHTPDFFIEEGPMQLGDDIVEVFHTPGHSEGSVSFYYPKGSWVISGDVLFNGSIGRTDLPGGDFDTLINSIRTHLLTLPGATTVLSGHGPSTHIADEEKNNPFLQ